MDEFDSKQSKGGCGISSICMGGNPNILKDILKQNRQFCTNIATHSYEAIVPIAPRAAVVKSRFYTGGKGDDGDYGYALRSESSSLAEAMSCSCQRRPASPRPVALAVVAVALNHAQTMTFWPMYVDRALAWTLGDTPLGAL